MYNEMEQEHTKTGIPLLGALVIFVCEAVLTYSLFKEWIGLTMVGIGHLAIVLTSSAWPVWLTLREQDAKLPILLVLLTLTMGVFGTGLCIVTILLYIIYSRNSTSFADWYASLFPEEKDGGQSSLYERITLGWEDFSEKTNMVPYMDVITLGTDQQKRVALEKITRHFTSELSPVLIKALDDPSNAIRVQAATVLAKLEQGFAKTASNLEKKIHKTSNSDKAAKLLLQLAKHYDTYVCAGFILDKDREQAIRNKAITMYERYVEIEPDDLDARFHLGRLYLKNQNIDKAYPLLKSCIENEDRPSPAKIWHYLECLYHRRDFDTLKETAGTYFSCLNPDDSESFKVMEMVRLWGGGILEPYLGKEGNHEQTA